VLYFRSHQHQPSWQPWTRPKIQPNKIPSSQLVDSQTLSRQIIDQVYCLHHNQVNNFWRIQVINLHRPSRQSFVLRSLHISQVTQLHSHPLSTPTGQPKSTNHTTNEAATQKTVSLFNKNALSLTNCTAFVYLFHDNLASIQAISQVLAHLVGYESGASWGSGPTLCVAQLSNPSTEPSRQPIKSPNCQIINGSLSTTIP